jgi:hypothetical protein
LPVELILRDVTVAQALHEPVRAVPPTDMQILDQERGNDHPDPIVHPALSLQLTHAGVDERITRLALFPAVSRSAAVVVRSGSSVGILANSGRIGLLTASGRWKSTSAKKSRQAIWRASAAAPFDRSELRSCSTVRGCKWPQRSAMER